MKNKMQSVNGISKKADLISPLRCDKVGLICAYVIFIAFIFENLLLSLIFYDIIVTIYYKEVEESILISQKSIIKLSLLYILKLFLTVIE